jgi:hexokinase
MTNRPNILSNATHHQLKHGTSKQQAVMEEIEEMFFVPEEKLNNLVRGVGREIRNGLTTSNTNGNPDSDLKMIPSFVAGKKKHKSFLKLIREHPFFFSHHFFYTSTITKGYPTGNERGTYLALEISGVDIYVCQVRLKGEGGKLAINQYQYKIPDHLTAGEDMGILIEYVADCVTDFQQRLGSSQEMIYAMGISVGFAVRQTGLDRGTILALEHGFEYPSAIGSDVVDLFHRTFQDKGLGVKIVAMANGKNIKKKIIKYLNSRSKLPLY